MKHLRCLNFILCAVLFFTATALADDDPPSRAVRLNHINGEVSVQPGGVDDWVPGTINRPLTTSDRVWTDKNARAELHLGTAAMRLNSETSLTLTNVSDNNVQLRLDQGTLNLRVAQLYSGEIYEINTPNVTFTILKPGSYRFDVDPTDDTSMVAVRKGEGEANSDGPGVRLRSKEQARFSDGNSGRHQISAASGFDGFDDWCRVRDEREDRSVAVRYVSRGVIGYEDLDGYGHWVSVAPYGHIWVPTSVVVGWAPYRYGHWIWVSPWGWTWVDDAPWGFAPFHYGRWIHYRGGWGWCPGPVVVRPYYAPALVAWVGGSSWGVGVSFGVGGGLGWFPLGYGEPYIPYYRGSRNYFRNVNVTNTRITNITYVTNNYYNNSANIKNIKYSNVRINGAVTAVSHETLVKSQPVHSHMVKVPNERFKNVSVMARPEVRPSRESMLGAREGTRAAVPPRWRSDANIRGEQEARHEKPGVDRPDHDRRDADRVRPANSKATEEIGREANNSHRINRRTSEPDSSARPSDATQNAHHVPRPPEPGANDKVAAERPTRYEVPRPPSRNPAVKDVAERATPAPNSSQEAHGSSAPNSSARAIPRPPKTERPVQSARKTAEDSATTRSQATVERERGSRSNERPAEARREPRPPTGHRGAPQRQVASTAEQSVPDSGRQAPRTPEVRHEASASQRKQAVRQGGKAEAQNQADQRPQSKDRGERGKSQD